MRMLVKFIGTASQYAGRVHVLQPADFQIEGGLSVLPTKGDLLLLPVNGRVEPVRFKCTGRHFDFASDDSPVMHIDLAYFPQVGRCICAQFPGCGVAV